MHLGNYLLVALAPLALGQGYLGPCLDMFMLVLALCWQRNPRPVQANNLAPICPVLVRCQTSHIHATHGLAQTQGIV